MYHRYSTYVQDIHTCTSEAGIQNTVSVISVSSEVRALKKPLPSSIVYFLRMYPYNIHELSLPYIHVILKRLPGTVAHSIDRTSLSP